MNGANSTPVWLGIGLPVVMLIGGLHAVITRSFFMAGGAKGGANEITGSTAVWFGIGMITLSVLAFVFFRYLGRKG